MIVENKLRGWIFIAVYTVVCAMLIQSVSAYKYNETNLTDYQQYPEISIPVDPLAMNIVNGTGALTLGYIPTVSRVQGMDIVIQLLIVQTIFLGAIMFILFAYVGVYLSRYLAGD